MNTPFLIKAVELAGGQSALAKGICEHIPGSKVSQAHVSKWLHRLKSPAPPGDYVIAIAKTVNYQVTPHQLRQDIYPHPHDGLPPDMRDNRLHGSHDEPVSAI